MTQYGTWVSYGGTARIALAIIVLAAAGGLAYAGTRFRHPVRLPRPGRAVTVAMLAAWVLSMAAFLACVTAYVRQERHDQIAKAPPANPITLVTIMAAFILFLIVFSATPHGVWTRLSSGIIAAMAAPMIFELPFDLIVMTRTYPPVPPDPALYRALFFAPLVLVELTTLSLLTLTPIAKLSGQACYCLALMLLVFAVWALAGFGYPSAPVPIAMNVTSKILAFITALSLFFPEWLTRWWRHQPDRGVEQLPDASQHAANAV
ncbi:MAG: hypothetical protein ABSA02_33675 [Trebonia sp.]|jgi:hypothetical protein